MSKQGSNPVPGLRYHNLTMDRGLRHLDMFGVRYYISFTPEATEEAAQYPELTEVGVAGPFHIYEAPPTDLVWRWPVSSLRCSWKTLTVNRTSSTFPWPGSR